MESVGVSPVVSGLAVGPGASGLENRAVASESDGVSPACSSPGGRWHEVGVVEVSGELVQAVGVTGDPVSGPVPVEGVLGDESAECGVSVDGASESLGHGRGQGQWSAVGVLGGGDGGGQCPDGVRVTAGGVLGDDGGQPVGPVPQGADEGVGVVDVDGQEAGEGGGVGLDESPVQGLGAAGPGQSGGRVVGGQWSPGQPDPVPEIGWGFVHRHGVNLTQTSVNRT